MYDNRAESKMLRPVHGLKPARLHCLVSFALSHYTRSNDCAAQQGIERQVSAACCESEHEEQNFSGKTDMKTEKGNGPLLTLLGNPGLGTFHSALEGRGMTFRMPVWSKNPRVMQGSVAAALGSNQTRQKVCHPDVTRLSFPRVVTDGHMDMSRDVVRPTMNLVVSAVKP